MEVSQNPSWICIKSNAASVVKRSPSFWLGWGFLFLLFQIFFLIRPLYSADVLETPESFSGEPTPPKTAPSSSNSPSPTPVNPALQTSDEEGPLPDIEAKTYDLKVVRRSNSNKIYLFEDLMDRKPTVGRILLMKKEQRPIMAFRVIRVYPDKKLVAAKRIKRYGRVHFLEDGDSYLAIEKISDVAPPAPTPQDRADLAEVESKQGLEILPFDPELDTATSPEELDEGKTTEAEIDDEDHDPHLALTVEEPKIIDHFIHWLSGGFGYLRNNGPPAAGGSYYFSAGNLKYGISLGRMVILDQPKLQDSITLETGVYIYKSINFATQGDAYTVASFLGSLRYNLMFSEAFGMFFYAGVIQSRVLSSASAQDSVIASLSSTQPAAGAGLLLQVGPSWYTRIDLGIDSLGLALLLHY
jgi:hypothetical protein